MEEQGRDNHQKFLFFGVRGVVLGLVISRVTHPLPIYFFERGGRFAASLSVVAVA